MNGCARTTNVQERGGKNQPTETGARVVVSALLYFLFTLRTTTTVLKYNLNIIYNQLVVVTNSWLYLSCTPQP